MKTLLLIPGYSTAAHDGRAPIAQSVALNSALCADAASSAAELNYDDVLRDKTPAVRSAVRWGGIEAGLAMMAFRRRREYNVILSGSEEIGIALSWLFQMVAQRPMHASVGHRLSSQLKRRALNKYILQRGIDFLLVHSQAQRDFAEDRVGFATERIALITPAVDDYFFRPTHGVGAANRICAAGWRARDYRILADALSVAPGWSADVIEYDPPSHAVKIPGSLNALPASGYDALRSLYATSTFVAVPMQDTDGSEGATAILQAMAMGKAVIATRTIGQPDLITDGVTGLSVAPGDLAGWRRSIARLADDQCLRERLGRNARRWVEEHAALDRWAGRVAYSLRSAYDSYVRPSWESDSLVSHMSGIW